MREIKFRAWDKEEKCWDEDGVLLGIAPDGEHVFYTDDDVPHDYEVSFFTGLKDKNGKEIFESDLVRDENGIVFEVFWDREAPMFALKNNMTETTIVEGVHEVIGNIYENPNLLNNHGE